MKDTKVLLKTKKLVREKLWFPGIDRLVENLVGKCLACHATLAILLQNLSTCPNFPTNHGLNQGSTFVDHSCQVTTHWWLLMNTLDSPKLIIKSLQTKPSLPKTKYQQPMVFQSKLNPTMVPLLIFKEFSDQSQHMGFHHRKITPLWPKANAETDRFMKTYEKDKPWKQELY